MENFLVGIIVAGALVFCVRSFIKIYKGEGDCGCSSSCKCTSLDQESCGKQFIHK